MQAASAASRIVIPPYAALYDKRTDTLIDLDLANKRSIATLICGVLTLGLFVPTIAAGKEGVDRLPTVGPKTHIIIDHVGAGYIEVPITKISGITGESKT